MENDVEISGKKLLRNLWRVLDATNKELLNAELELDYKSIATVNNYHYARGRQRLAQMIFDKVQEDLRLRTGDFIK